MFIYIFSNIEIYWADEDENKQCNRESHADILLTKYWLLSRFSKLYHKFVYEVKIRYIWKVGLVDIF